MTCDLQIACGLIGQMRMLFLLLFLSALLLEIRSRRGRDCMEVEFTTSCLISVYHHLTFRVKMYSIQHYVIKCVSDLRQDGGIFLQLFRFPQAIKLTVTI